MCTSLSEEYFTIICSAIADFIVTKIQVYHVPCAIPMVLQICPPLKDATQMTHDLLSSHRLLTWKLYMTLNFTTHWLNKATAKLTAWRRRQQNLFAISKLNRERALCEVKHSNPQLIYWNQPYRCPTGIKARHRILHLLPTNPTMSPRLVLTDNPPWLGVKSYQNPGDGDREGFWNVTWFEPPDTAVNPLRFY